LAFEREPISAELARTAPCAEVPPCVVRYQE
jgi:hypothetical protein